MVVVACAHCVCVILLCVCVWYRSAFVQWIVHYVMASWALARVRLHSSTMKHTVLLTLQRDQ